MAILATVGLALLFVFMDYVRFIGSHHEQVSAIEAAALAAAGDLSRIVIEDRDLGFVSLSDRSPTGSGTISGDNFYTPVVGINTLIATNRLDMIVAELLDDNVLRQCADRDYNRIAQARQTLTTELNKSVQRGWTGKDVEGQTIDPWSDALAAYNQNVIRISSGKNRILANTLVLTIGCQEELATNIPIPKPTQFAEIGPDDHENFYYKSYINVPYKGKDFVFAATGANLALTEVKRFRQTLPLPYFVPAIIKCEADQRYDSNDQLGRPTSRTVHAVACARPACQYEKCVAPGVFALSFPNGSIPELPDWHSILVSAQISKSPTDYTKSPPDGDFPDTPALTKFKLPPLNTAQPPFGQTLRVAFYDWMRRGRAHMNVQSLLDAMKKPLSVNANPHADYFFVASDGTVTLGSMPISDTSILPVSHKQWVGVSGLGYRTALPDEKTFDVFLKDYVWQPGRTLGGLHSGEPLGDPTPPLASGAAPVPSIKENPVFASKFPVGPASGAVRPTWNKNGIAVELRFKKR